MLVKVSSKTNPKKLAYALYNMQKETKEQLILQAIGAGAVNQMLKSIIVLRGLLAPLNKDLKAVFGFAEVEIDGKNLTAIQAALEI